MRSDIQPQHCRLTKAVPSSSDSIAAPCAGAMPRSLQNATRCPCGMAIGTQQQNDASDSKASATPGRNPSARAPGSRPAAPMPAAGACGGGRRKSAAAGTITATAATAKNTMVCCQP